MYRVSSTVEYYTEHVLPPLCSDRKAPPPTWTCPKIVPDIVQAHLDLYPMSYCLLLGVQGLYIIFWTFSETDEYLDKCSFFVAEPLICWRPFIHPCEWKYEDKHLPASHHPSSSASAFDLVAAAPEGGKGERERERMIRLAVKPPPVNELSSADWSSHTTEQTSGPCASDLLFTLTPHNVFIHRHVCQLSSRFHH